MERVYGPLRGPIDRAVPPTHREDEPAPHALDREGTSKRAGWPSSTYAIASPSRSAGAVLVANRPGTVHHRSWRGPQNPARRQAQESERRIGKHKQDKHRSRNREQRCGVEEIAQRQTQAELPQIERRGAGVARSDHEAAGGHTRGDDQRRGSEAQAEPPDAHRCGREVVHLLERAQEHDQRHTGTQRTRSGRLHAQVRKKAPHDAVLPSPSPRVERPDACHDRRQRRNDERIGENEREFQRQPAEEEFQECRHRTRAPSRPRHRCASTTLADPVSQRAQPNHGARAGAPAQRDPLDEGASGRYHPTQCSFRYRTKSGMSFAKNGTSSVDNITYKSTFLPRHRRREKPWATRLLDRHTPMIVTPGYVTA